MSETITDSTPCLSHCLRQGFTKLGFVQGAQGYGVALVNSNAGVDTLVADSGKPFGVFYGKPSASALNSQDFAAVSSENGILKASRTFTDACNNLWEVLFTGEPWSDNGILGTYTITLISGTARDAYFFFPLNPAMSREDTYVFFPGLVYDGNTLSANDLPGVRPKRHNTIEIETTRLSAPACGFYDKATGVYFHCASTQGTRLGNSSFSYHLQGVPERRHEARLTVPRYMTEESLEPYQRPQWQPFDGTGANWNAGDRLCVEILYLAGAGAALRDFYGDFHAVRDYCAGPGASHRKTLPISKAFELTEAMFNSLKWLNDSYYANAITGQHNAGDPVDWYWHLNTGWCDGTVTALGLLSRGTEASRGRARTMIDFMCDQGRSPAGLIYTLFDGHKWYKTPADWNHAYKIRFAADEAYYLALAMELELARGTGHSNWRDTLHANLSAFATLWERYGEFGHEVNYDTLQMVTPGSSAGSLCIGALALGGKLLGEERFLNAACAAADLYYARHVVTGLITGGPADIDVNTPDSESVAALLESFVTLFEATRDRKYLRYAAETADIMATWVVAYNADLPPSSTLGAKGIQTAGGVLANSQNQHIGPCACTQSLSSLFRLYRHAGAERYLRLLESIVTGIPQYVTREDGYFPDMKRGMITERITMGNYYCPPGEIWAVSATWPEAGLFLTRAQIPGVYVDASRGRMAVFDHLDVTTDFGARTLSIANPTVYPSTFSVFLDGKESWEKSFSLSPGEKRSLQFADLSEQAKGLRSAQPERFTTRLEYQA